MYSISLCKSSQYPRNATKSSIKVQKSKNTNIYDNKQYNQLKKTFMEDSHKAARTVSAISLLTFDVDTVLSVCIGAGFSSAYAHTMVKYVDEIEHKSWPIHTFMFPALLVAVETTMNNSMGFHLNYLEMFAGFFSYKYAIFKILCDEIFQPVD